MQPGAQGTYEHRTAKEGKHLYEVAGNRKAKDDLLDLVSVDLQQFPCISSEPTFINVCAGTLPFGCCRRILSFRVRLNLVCVESDC